MTTARLNLNIRILLRMASKLNRAKPPIGTVTGKKAWVLIKTIKNKDYGIFIPTIRLSITPKASIKMGDAMEYGWGEITTVI
jgi:hypothetical protein